MISDPIPPADRRLVRRFATLVILIITAGLSAGCRPEPPAPTARVTSSETTPGTPRLTAVEKSLLEIVDAKPKSVDASMIRFRDVTDMTSITFVHVSGNSPDKHFPTANGSGLALFDYDGDGKLDIYFCTTRELPRSGPTKSKGNRLYRNKGDGTFEDVTELAGVGYNGFNHGVAVGRRIVCGCQY